jgi:excisionase family DNA binding protein
MNSTGLSDDERKGRSADAASRLEPLTVTIATARQISGLSNTTVYKLIKEGKLDTIKIGVRTLIPYASLKALLQPATN